MPHRKMTLPLLLSCAMLLTACAGSRPAERVIIASPETLLTCQDAPAIPEAPTQRDVARLLVDYHEAPGDCRGKLDAIRGLAHAAVG